MSVPVDCPAYVWTKIVDGELAAKVRVTLTDPSKYYYDIVAAGDPPPDPEIITGSILSVFGKDFQGRDPIDVYLYAFDAAGRVDVDLDPPFTDVFVQDQSTPPVEFFLTQDLNAVVINASAGAKTKVLSLDPGHGVIVGNLLEIYIEKPIGDLILKRFMQLRAVAVVGDLITCQPFFGIDIVPGAEIIFSNRVSPNMNVNGSVTPIPFSIGPPNGFKWDLTRTTFGMICTTNPDDALFGNLAQLPNGIFFGFENDLGQEYLVNLQTNAGFRGTAYDVTYTTRSSGGGSYGVSIRKSFAGQDKYGVVVRLAGPTTDIFVVYINDDLTGLVEFGEKVMGHIVE